jgi:hypothetical protein
MRKLTEKIKYKIVDGHAELFAKLLTTGKYAKFATCHLSAVDHIEKHGFKATLDLGCIRFV